MINNALITGGTRGIGKCIADLLTEKLWHVAALGRKDFDIANPKSVSDYFINKYPHDVPLDAIVFSNGEWYSESFRLQSPMSYRRQYESRVVQPVKIINDFSTDLEMSKIGCVVFVSSTRGFIGGKETAPYSLACAAQIALVQGLAREYEGIRFNVVCPGLTATDMGREVISTGGAKLDAIGQEPKVVAQVIVDLILDTESNGKVIRVVDGKASEAKWNW